MHAEGCRTMSNLSAGAMGAIFLFLSLFLFPFLPVPGGPAPAAAQEAATTQEAAAQEAGPDEAGTSDVLVLTNARLVDLESAPARVVPEATVVVRNGKIAAVETGDVAAPAGARVLDLQGRYLLPGLIDAHVHLSSLEDARRALESGVTTARSAGVSHFADVGLRELRRAGHVEIPEVLAAGYHVRPEPSRELFLDEPELGDLLESGVRDVAAVRRVTRANLARGVDFVKVVATARAGLPETDPREPLYGVEELRALVETASEAGVPVMAHAHGDEGGRAAVLAGVRSIEHGTYLTDSTLALMAERGTYLVPTIAVVTDLTAPGGDYDHPFLRIRGRHMLPRVRRTAGRAHARGVKVVAATDTGYGSESTVRLGHELEELVEVGLTPREALRAATVVAAELLGVEGRTGRIAAGLEADMIAVDRDPLRDIRAVQDPLLVVSDGKVVVERLEWSR